MSSSLQRGRLKIGDISLKNNVLLAPMSGVSDLPFRRLAARFGAGAVVSEMVASKELVAGRKHVLGRVNWVDQSGDESGPNIIQLAGTEPHWMAEGARIAVQLGAQIIDINMGCPAREVTGKQSGSALMRDLDHAERLVAAVCEAVDVPVTLKMRLGWDHKTKNAPELGRRAERLGVRLLTVHGRTRCEFFKGAASWTEIAPIKAAVGIPVIANGDITDLDSALTALELSQADGLMIGRGAYGAPWIPGRIATALDTGIDPGDPTLDDQQHIAIGHVRDMLAHYGLFLGLRNARKHIGWYLERAGATGTDLKSWRRQLCTEADPQAVCDGLANFYEVRKTMTSRMQENAA